MKRLIVVFLMVILGVALVYACGSESDEQFSGNFLEISLTCPDLKETAELSRTLGIERDINDIVELELIVSNGNPPIVPISDVFGPDEPIIINIPIGTDRLIEVFGLDDLGNVICQGSLVTDITVDTTDININCDFVFEDCTDGIDNDFDDLIDCQDPDCEDTCMEPGDDDDDQGDDDDDNNDIPAFEDDSAGECSDGIDNDEDGFTDCVDNDCLRSVDCLFQLPPPLPPPPPACDEKNPDCSKRACCDACKGDGPNCDEFKIPAFCSNPE